MPPKNGVKLQTSENFPFVPVEQFVCKLIKEDVIGNVHKCHRLFLYNRLPWDSLQYGVVWMPTRKQSAASDHTMPVTPYVDRAKRDFNRENLEFYAIDFDNGGLGIAMVGNKNGCLGRNKLVGFETCGGARHNYHQREIRVPLVVKTVKRLHR